MLGITANVNPKTRSATIAYCNECEPERKSATVGYCNKCEPERKSATITQARPI
jgi:hypothetical protein